MLSSSGALVPSFQMLPESHSNSYLLIFIAYLLNNLFLCLIFSIKWNNKLSYYLVMLCHFKIALIFKEAKLKKLNLFRYNSHAKLARDILNLKCTTYFIHGMLAFSNHSECVGTSISSIREKRLSRNLRINSYIINAKLKVLGFSTVWWSTLNFNLKLFYYYICFRFLC